MSAATSDSDSEEFYDRHWAHADTAADPEIVAKGDLVLRLVPEGVRTVADVGCGDGYLTHRLAERFDVTALDRSAVALSRVRVRAIQASADALPLPDRAVDLVFSSELLEHLPGPLLSGAAREFERVADRYLLISVPHRETLRRRFVRCPSCRLEFHIDGHLQSFAPESLDALFPSFERIATELAGPPEPATRAPIEWLRQRACRRWFLWDGLQLTCPRCSETRFPKPARSPLHRAAERALDVVAARWNAWAGLGPLPYWLIALYRRRPSSG
jgi:SAM-dependent methyltransferase